MVKSIMTKKHNGLYKKLEHFLGKKGIIKIKKELARRPWRALRSSFYFA
jgi:hypothetical protein